MKVVTVYFEILNSFCLFCAGMTGKKKRTVYRKTRKRKGHGGDRKKSAITEEKRLQQEE